MKEEIIGGIKNAMEHGASLEEVAKSFVAAGYSEKEVNDAVQELSLGATSMIASKKYDDSKINPIPVPTYPPSVPVKKKTKQWMLILLIILIMIIAGAILFVIFSDKIIQFISSL